jgi:inhibitor of cysteine peptidase
MTIMLGGTSSMYVSLNNIYITFPESDGQTSIYRIQIQGRDLTYKAHGKVLGRELNQFSMDENGGYFRIATATWLNGNPESNLYVLDMDLATVGKLKNIAPNETLDSARFIGNRCYLSTSVVLRDPFFVIDVADPADPQILGYLKIPGFTRYLHPYDADHIIGIGKDGNNVKLSLFDVSNVSAPTEIDNYTIEADWSDASVLRDHKAFLFSKDENLLALPIEMRYYTPYSAWQGLYAFDITLGSGIVKRGTVSHQEYGVSEWDTTYYVERSCYIEDMLYTVSQRKIVICNLSDVSFVKEIVLN